MNAIEQRILPDPASGPTWSAAASAAAKAAAGTSSRRAGETRIGAARDGTTRELREEESLGTSPAVSDRVNGGGGEFVEDSGGVGIGGGNPRGTQDYVEAQWRSGEEGYDNGRAPPPRRPQMNGIGDRFEKGEGGEASGVPGNAAAVVPAGKEGEAASRLHDEKNVATSRVTNSSRLEGCELGNKSVLWVNVRRAPVEVIPAVVRRVTLALKAVGHVSDGLIVEWAGGLEADGANDSGSIAGSGGTWGEGGGRGSSSSVEGGGRSPRSAARAGRREMLLQAFAGVEPAIEVVEPSRCRGQVREWLSPLWIVLCCQFGVRGVSSSYGSGCCRAGRGKGRRGAGR